MTKEAKNECWFMERDDGLEGPLTRETIDARLYAGIITPTTILSADGKNLAPASSFFDARRFAPAPMRSTETGRTPGFGTRTCSVPNDTRVARSSMPAVGRAIIGGAGVVLLCMAIFAIVRLTGSGRPADPWIETTKKEADSLWASGDHDEAVDKYLLIMQRVSPPAKWNEKISGDDASTVYSRVIDHRYEEKNRYAADNLDEAVARGIPLKLTNISAITRLKQIGPGQDERYTTDPGVKMQDFVRPSDRVLRELAVSAVTKNLKAPSTAKFPSTAEQFTITPTQHKTSASVMAWQISSWVDAQNSFGAMLRSRFVVCVYYNSFSGLQTEIVQFGE